jgi:hypothetical protein
LNAALQEGLGRYLTKTVQGRPKFVSVQALGMIRRCFCPTRCSKAVIGKQVGLVRVDKPIAYLDIDETGLIEAGYGPEA